MTFSVELSSRAERDLARLPAKVQTSIVQALRELALDPYHAGNVKRLSAEHRAYRLRVGDYRAVYQLSDDRQQILVLRVRHRRDAYRGRS